MNSTATHANPFEQLNGLSKTISKAKNRKKTILRDAMLAYRIKHKLTQQGLADQLGIKRSMIGAYEEGRCLPKVPVLKQMAKLFKKSLDKLMADQ